MNPEIKIEEQNKLNDVLKILDEAKFELTDSLEKMGAGNLQKLAEIKETEGGPDFEMFLERLHEENTAFNFKDKYKRLEELDFLIREPYFARIDLKDNTKDSETPYSKIYIGKFGYTRNIPIVTDWRTKVASVYYRYRYPQKNVAYETPAGREVRDLMLKRTFEIDSGELVKYYNNDIQLDENEIIVDKIKQRTGGVLEDIVETIQTSQLDIIESDPRQVCIVQGCVGSGKSTVAIHKLAHIFFNFPNLIRANRSILVAKNQILVGYLSTLFPKLGIFDINFKTLRELIVNVIFREEMTIKVDLDQSESTTSFKISNFNSLISEIDKVHDKISAKINDIVSDVEYETFSGLKYSKDLTPYENISDYLLDLEEELGMQKEKIKENPNSTRAWIFKENIKNLRSLIRKLTDVKTSIRGKELPRIIKLFKIDQSKPLGYKEALIYVAVYAELIGITKMQKYEYCVVDEGQDFSILEFYALSKVVLRGRFGIFGDLNQSLDSDGISSWDDIKKVIAEVKSASSFQLDTNYRSTKPIIDYANSILSKFTKDYLPKSINRMGPEPVNTNFKSPSDLLSRFETEINKDHKKLDKSIGVIVYDESLYDSARKILNSLNSDKLLVLESKSKIQYLPKGIYLMHFEDCKGLEFSKVYVLGLNVKNIKTAANARKAFVAVTRAMTELSVFGLE